MTKTIVFRGRRGSSNVNGIAGLGVSDVQKTPLDSPVYEVLSSNQLSKAGNINFDRGALASHNNRHHINVWARNSSTSNFILFSEDFSQWDDPANKYSIIGATADPLGGTGATEINLDIDTDNLIGLGPVLEDFPDPSMIVGSHVTVSFQLKIISGTITGLDIGQGATKFTLPAPTSSFQVFKISIPVLSTGFLFSINPRGKLGARFALFRVQIEDNLTTTDYIKTEGSKVTVAFNGEIERESDKGWLIEQEKENAVIFSADFSGASWVKTNVTIDTFADEDPFLDKNQNIRLVWGSVPAVTLAGNTATLTPSTTYTISFYALITAGSLSALTVSLGGGEAVQMPVVSTTEFTRISVEVISGTGTGILISATSDNLTASLNISGVQAELGRLTTYIKTGTLAQTRLADVVTADIAFNIPRPDKSWSFIFRHVSVLNNADKKLVFTNNETGSTEFSCFFTDGNLTLKNGASETVIAGLAIEKIAITFNGATLKFYNEKVLLSSTAITPTTFLATTIFIGMNSAKLNAINAHLSNLLFYDVELKANEIINLMGD